MKCSIPPEHPEDKISDGRFRRGIRKELGLWVEKREKN
ncbi:hypothetical protein RO1_31210 [Roseburia intestinalis XB6B4]|uniref:Uncharacterized protein n=1 Tax=Roseburia intestinalis XB6B4 TaxID=718255 RepID=D4L1H0_9FIRM|nr:hypothetical protein RO1_31210 [Roseburia intestinalis XB6B4]